MFLHDPQAAPNAWKLTQEAAPRLGITLQQAQVGAAEELLPELTVIEKERPDAHVRASARARSFRSCGFSSRSRRGLPHDGSANENNPYRE
jgi:hypothetical protein